MKHSNNMREKVTRLDNAEATAKKAAEGRKGVAHMDPDKGRIEIGKGVANAGVGSGRMIGPLERLAPFEEPKSRNEQVGVSGGATAVQKKAGGNKSTWIKGSSESKKIVGNHTVKGKL
jgi:hypothetical protein